MKTVTALSLLISLFCYSQNSWALDFSEVFKTPDLTASEVKLIDARSRNRWLKGRLKNSVFFDWDHFSQPGAGSRGSLRLDPQVVADDLANSGFSLKDTIYIYGEGASGQGNEGRIAWLLYGLGFEKIHITDFKTAKAWSKTPSEKGPYIPKPVKKWVPNVKTDLTLNFDDFKKWTKNKNKKYVVMDLRGKYADTKLPGLYYPPDLNIYWKMFLGQSDLAHNLILEYYQKNKYDKSVPIFPLSFAGLRSAYICLILKSWGFNAMVIPEGYSIELK